MINTKDGDVSQSVPVDAPVGIQLEAMGYKVTGFSNQPPGTPDAELACEQVWFILTIPVAGTATQIRFRLKTKRAYDEFMEAFRKAGSGRWKDAPVDVPADSQDAPPG